MFLKQVIDDPNTTAGRVFALTIQSLILVSIVNFSLGTLPSLTDSQRSILRYIEIGTVLVFTAEYLTRLALADQPLKFATSFFGVIDLLAILPFYLSLGIDFRSIRVFRLLRLFRILKLARYSKAVRRFHRALIIAREDAVLFGLIALIILYLASVGIYYFERDTQPEAFASVFHSLWWATVTLTTVGYGDVYPITTGGKCFTFVVLLVGLGFVSVPAGLIASAFAKAREMDDEL